MHVYFKYKVQGVHTLSAVYINDYNLLNGCKDITGGVNKTVTGSCHFSQHSSQGAQMWFDD